jgi:hypothetical protein
MDAVNGEETLRQLSVQAANLERVGRALVASRAGTAGGRGSVGRNVVLVALLLSLHTVLVATGTAIVVVGLLTGHSWHELVLRLVQ